MTSITVLLITAGHTSMTVVGYTLSRRR